MGKFSRDKGLRFEREVVALFSDAGISAERVPLSGAHHGRFSGDVWAYPPPGARKMRLELKKRADGFKGLYSLLTDDIDGLILGADRKPPLIVMPLSVFFSMVTEQKGEHHDQENKE